MYQLNLKRLDRIDASYDLKETKINNFLCNIIGFIWMFIEKKWLLLLIRLAF